MEGADAWTSGQIYLAVIQSVLIYRSETCVKKTRNSRVLGSFHHRLAFRLTGRQPQIWRDVVWIYPLTENEMIEAGIQEMETYVSFRQNTVTQFIADRPIMDLCLVTEQRTRPMISNQW